LDASREKNVAKGGIMNSSQSDPIAGFTEDLDPKHAAVCHKLRAIIDRELPAATSKLWHAIPVWFVGENAVVGYDARKAGIVLMFWNGQKFETGGLEASGSFHVGQILYTDPAEIDEALMARWLKEAGTNIWDMVGERRAFVARRKAKKAKAEVKEKARPKAKARPQSKALPRARTKRMAKAKSKRKARSKARAKKK
jgi:hypothetical protein